LLKKLLQLMTEISKKIVLQISKRTKILFLLLIVNLTMASYVIGSDSLEYTLTNAILLNNKANNTIEYYPSVSLSYSLKAYKIILKFNDLKLTQEIVRNIAEAYDALGNNYMALDFYKKLLTLSLKNADEKSQMIALDKLGELHRLIGIFDKSLENHLKALDIAKKINDNNYISLIYNNIGVIYRNIDDQSKSRQYYNDALKIGLQQKNYYSISKTYENLGNLYWYNHDYDSSLIYYEIAYSYSEMNRINYLSVKSGLLNNMGNAYRGKKQYKKALTLYDKAYKICLKAKNKNLQSVVLKNIATAYYNIGNNSLSIEYFNKSILIASEIDLKRILIENYNILSEIYAKTGDYKQSLNYYKLFSAYQDSVFYSERNYRLNELEIKYKEKENIEIINKLYYNKQKIIFLSSAIVTIISISLLLVILSRYRNKKSDAKKIEEQSFILKLLNEELLNQNQELTKERENLENSETLYRALFELSEEGKLLLDKKGNILKINEAFLKIVGMDISKELMSINIFQLGVLKRTKILQSFSEVIENKTVVYGDANIRNAKSENIFISYHIIPIFNKNNELIRIQAVVHDITEKQKSELALIKSEQKLRELNVTKDKFFSIIAHDIKNPFNAIMGFSHLLKEDYHSFSDDERLQFIGNISKASEDVYNLLENLLKWSWTQSGKIGFNPQKIDIKYICSESVDVLSLQANNKHIKIENSISDSVYVFADENMMKTVFRNLISNAIKFTHENGKVSIFYAICEKQKTEINSTFVEIHIKDNGIGISEEDLNKIFRIEEKITSRGTNNETGTGLGLILCKEFVEKNGGKIKVESELGKGSTFIFTIPLFN